MNLDDYFGLLSSDFSDVTTVIFTGPSGSGKSSQIRLLLEAHEQFGTMSTRCISPQSPRFSWRDCRDRLVREPVDLLVVDEIGTLLDALRVRKLLRHVPRQMIASHLVPWAIRRAGAAVWHIDTATCSAKLARYLDREGVTYTGRDLERYVSRYGPVFTELQIMLEASPAATFGEVWESFHRFHRISQVA